MTAPLLSAAMIVRDESAFLPDCLASIQPVVDEMVIVDTGSVDDTVAIAESFGARVAHRPWDGSFAEPRNLALDLAAGGWILYIDADERLRPIDPTDVRARLTAADAAGEIALRLLLTPFVGATPFWEYRLWRSDPRVRFDGRMHEKMTPAIARLAQAGGLIGESALHLDHVGYEGDQTHKHRRNLPLLRRRIAEDPNDPYNWEHLSKVLAGLGETDASDEAQQEALALVRGRHHDSGPGIYSRAIMRRRGLGEDASDLLGEGLGLYPDSIILAWHKVEEEIAARHFEEALWWLERFDVDPERPVEDTTAFHADLILLDAVRARAACLFALGRYAEAAEANARAHERQPQEDGHRVRRLLAEHLAARAAADPGRAAVDGPAPPSPHPGGFDARELTGGLTVDAAGIPLALAASDAARGRAVHALLGRLEPTTAEPVARLSFGRHAVALPAREPDETMGSLRLWHDKVLHASALGTFTARATDDEGAVGGDGRGLGGLTAAFSGFGPFVLARLLAEHHRFVMHAAAIRRGTDVVLVLGSSGAGKSTLVAAALGGGWDALADDLVVLGPGADGPIATGIPRTLRVPADAADPEVPGARSTQDLRGRIEIPFDAFDRGTHPVSAVVVVTHGTADAASGATLDRPERLATLVACMFSRRRDHVRRFLPVASRLTDVPTLHLQHGTDPAGRGRSSLRLLEAWLAVESSPAPAGATAATPRG